MEKTLFENFNLKYFRAGQKEIIQSIIEQIVSKKKVPVIAPLGLDKDNQVFNINADTAAGAIAKKLNARRLVIMSDV